MPIKWVQCQQCFTTMHINAFPEPDRKACSKTGFGICKSCLGASGMRFKSRLEVFGPEFFSFMEGDNNEA